MKKLHELTREDMSTPRYARARRFADMMLSLSRDFIGHDRIVHRQFLEVMLEAGWVTNAEIINVPDAWDALNKLEIEMAMIEQHPLYAGVGSAASQTVSQPTLTPRRPLE